ncbi:hypothetical protein F66182_8531 [Fusarium sp. NRRL 66182]|nr:hypothetical protein F66182_8531 [Fusarium sp. NRRL 66182]
MAYLWNTVLIDKHFSLARSFKTWLTFSRTQARGRHQVALPLPRSHLQRVLRRPAEKQSQSRVSSPDVARIIFEKALDCDTNRYGESLWNIEVHRRVLAFAFRETGDWAAGNYRYYTGFIDIAVKQSKLGELQVRLRELRLAQSIAKHMKEAGRERTKSDFLKTIYEEVKWTQYKFYQHRADGNKGLALLKVSTTMRMSSALDYSAFDASKEPRLQQVVLEILILKLKLAPTVPTKTIDVKNPKQHVEDDTRNTNILILLG